MGCVASRIDQEERVKVCRERKRLMRQLLLLRGEFSSAQCDYLRALKNTGITLKQFTESESLEIESNPSKLFLPPSPPPSLPPSPPPPPPPLSPDSGKAPDNPKSEISREESIEMRENDGNMPPPLPVPSYSWGHWVFDTSMPHLLMKDDPGEQVEEENWEETKSEFEGEEDDVSDNSSTMNLCGKYASNMAMVEWRGKKTLEDIIKELDDYFLRASAGEKDIAVFMDINTGDTSLHHSFAENKWKRSNSAKVFSALSWSWSSRPLQFTPDAVSSCDLSKPCRPGAHSITLDKLYAAEQKLYKDIKEEEMTKLEHEKKSTLLKKQENENYNWIKAEKTRSCVENLECDIGRLQQSISEHGSSILKLIDEELYPQLVAIISGLAHMWRTMQECHQVQNHISQYLNHITDDKNIDMTTKNRRQAAVQLETEISSWYNSFCKLTKSQQDYVGTLCVWIRLTDHLGDNHQQSCCRSAVRRLCERWLVAFGKLPDTVAAEAIKSFLSAIQSVSQQQLEELRLHKKLDRLERRLQKELDLVADMERKLKLNLAVEDIPNPSDLSPKHPLLVKHAKIDTLKKNLEIEKAKFVNSVESTRAMTLNSLKTGLPKVFQALMAFASASAQAFEVIHGQFRQSSGCDSSVHGQIEQSSGCDSSEISVN